MKRHGQIEYCRATPTPVTRYVTPTPPDLSNVERQQYLLRVMRQQHPQARVMWSDKSYNRNLFIYLFIQLTGCTLYIQKYEKLQESSLHESIENQGIYKEM